MVLNSAPRTWVAGEIPTAGNFNTEVRDAFNGLQAAWQAYTPTVSGVTVGSMTARYHQVGKWVTVRMQFALTATPTAAVLITAPTSMNTTIPLSTSQCLPIGNAVGLRQGSAFRVGTVIQNTATQVGIISDGSGGSLWAPSQPVAWANTDIWGLHFSYEAA